MLKNLFKKNAEQSAEDKKEVEMTVDNAALTAQLEEATALATLQASFDAQAAELAAAVEQNVQMTTEIESLKSQLEEFAEAKAKAEAAAKEMAAKAHQEKMDSRMAALKTEFGDEKAARLFKVAEKMEDTEFSEVFGLQKEMAANEEAAFAEQGVDAKAEEVAEQPTSFMKFIKKESK